MRIAPLSVLVACCLSTAACTAHAEDAKTPPSQGTGETRQVEDFHGVSVGHGMHAQVKVGPKSVRLEGPAESLSRIRLVVEDGILTTRIERKGLWGGLNGRVRLIVSSPRIDQVEASGGSHMEAEATAADEFEAEASGGAEITVRGVDAKKVDAEASGGAQVTLIGRAEHVDAEVSGGSQLHARELQGVKSLDVDASGGAIVEADAPSSVSGEASGGSVISLSVRPQNSKLEVSGGSRIDSKR
ncbi:DUF2807 domain-containing protein [Corallococcus sp. ZKHCc1 1396]|uniref:DUF2807 domain-containing protein n=1 Tax=Corallococcus soli TaxID=2710757 RepID=A0ABR9PWF6_9BACT|nr:head GIN domain-containing protein [Corallococcus soli]MBE4752255.1 DUF2807 domain-containing protein [Corallococcus soli]